MPLHNLRINLTNKPTHKPPFFFKKNRTDCKCSGSSQNQLDVKTTGGGGVRKIQRMVRMEIMLIEEMRAEGGQQNEEERSIISSIRAACQQLYWQLLGPFGG